MLLVKKSGIRDYFSVDPQVYAPFPSHVGLSRNRFQAILRYLHVNDNNTAKPRDDPEHNPLYDLLNRRFKDLYTASPNLTIDEAIAPFRGSLSFKVYMKNKPQKYGVRIECVADASSGVVVHMEIYSGQAGGLDNTVKDLVIRLLEDLGDKHHSVYMDRRYSSPELFQALLDRVFYPVGTVMKSRKHLPKAFDAAGRLAAGEKVTRRKGQLLALRWKEKRDVYILSTTVPDTMENTGRPATEAGGHQQQKPAAVLDYNSNKAGVDRHDQMSSYYPLARKTINWWKKLFFQLLTMALVNAHKYYDIHNESKSWLECFIRQLAKDLSCVDLDDPPPHPTASLETRRFRPGAHFPTRIPPTSEKQNPTRRCVLCKEVVDAVTKKPRRRKSSWECCSCRVALCVSCFWPYHCPNSRLAKAQYPT